MVGYYLLIWIEFIPLLAPHCEPNGFYDGGDNDDSDDDDDDGKDTCQYVFNTYEYWSRSRLRLCVHPSPHSAKSSTMPINEQQYPMAAVHKISNTHGVCKLHVCLPQSPFSNQYAKLFQYVCQ